MSEESKVVGLGKHSPREVLLNLLQLSGELKHVVIVYETKDEELKMVTSNIGARDLVYLLHMGLTYSKSVKQY